MIAWRKTLEARNLTPASIRRKLSSLSSLFDYSCEHNAMAGNPMDGVERPAANGNEGSTHKPGHKGVRQDLPKIFASKVVLLRGLPCDIVAESI